MNSFLEILYVTIISNTFFVSCIRYMLLILHFEIMFTFHESWFIVPVLLLLPTGMKTVVTVDTRFCNQIVQEN